MSNPLDITIFPPIPSHRPPNPHPPILPNLDIFATGSLAYINTAGGLSGYFGLLHVVDERLAAYGFATNTGVRFAFVVDNGKGGQMGTRGGGTGLREGELKVVCIPTSPKNIFD
jgi:trafficking protein particle complex subunit 2